MKNDGYYNLAENIVETVLHDLVKRSKIASFNRSKHNDNLDASGIDFLIILNGGLAVPLQCKTYSKKNKERLLEHERKHPEIKYIIFVMTHGFNRNKRKIYLLVERDILNIIKSADR